LMEKNLFEVLHHHRDIGFFRLGRAIWGKSFLGEGDKLDYSKLEEMIKSIKKAFDPKFLTYSASFSSMKWIGTMMALMPFVANPPSEILNNLINAAFGSFTGVFRGFKGISM